jgi:hypothetical protein
LPEGETEIGLPGILPGFQTYEEAPLPVNVVLLPEQIGFVPAVAVTVGVGFTVIATCAVPLHPDVVPVTVYVVLPVGETLIGLPEIFPGFHT